MNILTLFTFLGRLGSNEEDLRRYEERIATLKQQLSQEKERNEELKAKVGDGSRASQDELRASQTEKTRLQREVRHARGSDGRGIVGSVTHQPSVLVDVHQTIETTFVSFLSLAQDEASQHPLLDPRQCVRCQSRGAENKISK